MRWSLLLAVAIAAAVVRTVSTQSALPDVATLLDRYAAGRFDEATRPVANATEDQARALRAQLMTAGRLWIDAPGKPRADRMAAAAMFALETEAIRAERGEWAAPTDYICAGRCIVEWACALFYERGPSSSEMAVDPDAIEHAWFAASVTLASGVRDWGFLHVPRLVSEPFGESKGHVDHALVRFPDDVRFRFARAQSVAARFEVTTEQDEPREGTRLDFPAPVVSAIVVNGVSIGTPPRSASATRRSAQRQLTLKELVDLSSDPTLGASARTRVAYLHWTIGDYADAITEAEAAALQATDPDVRYLARYIAGMAAQSSGALANAESQFAAALDARPHSQSASIALAALRFQRGDAAGAYALSEESLTKLKNDDDPWRLFQYGDYATLPAKIQAMRRAFAAGVAR